MLYRGESTISHNLENRTRLWLSSPHFYPTYGGAQNRYRGYIPGFLARNLDVRVMTGTPLIEERRGSDDNADWYEADVGSWLPETVLDGAPLERIRLPDKKGAERTRIYYEGLLKVCRRPVNVPVVTQLLTNIRPEALPWLRELRASGVATLYSVSQFPTWQKKPHKRLLRLPGYRRAYNAFDALVTNSQAIRGFLREIGVTTRIEYIPNGVDLSRFHPIASEQENQEREAIRQRFGIPHSHQVIVAVGSVIPRKGPDLILQAWGQLLGRFPDTHLLFVGPRADLHDPNLRAFGGEISGLVTASGAANQVHFTGMVDDVEKYLRAADTLVLASSREGTPNSVLEAMATGLPCLVTSYLGLSEGIGRAGEHYLLVDRTPDSIAAALTELLQNTTLRSSLAERGRQYVVDHVDQQRSLDSYAALYEELAALARSHR